MILRSAHSRRTKYTPVDTDAPASSRAFHRSVHVPAGRSPSSTTCTCLPAASYTATRTCEASGSARENVVVPRAGFGEASARSMRVGSTPSLTAVVPVGWRNANPLSLPWMSTADSL